MDTEKIIEVNGKKYLQKHHTNEEFGIDVISYSEANGDQLSKSCGKPSSIHYDPKTKQIKKKYYIYRDTDEYTVVTYYKNDKKVVEHYNLQDIYDKENVKERKFAVKKSTKIEYYIGNEEVLFKDTRRFSQVYESNKEKQIWIDLERIAKREEIHVITLIDEYEKEFLSDLEEY